MSAPKGIAAVAWLARRSKEQRGGNAPKPDGFERGTPDALALWRDAYLESLASRNYSPGTLEGRRDALKMFLGWAAERDLKQAGQITRPILENFQRCLWRHQKPNGQRLGWSTQRNRLGILKDFFRWLTRQNVILHNPASELELPRMEKRLPQEALSPGELARLLAIPDVADPLGVRDRAMLELFYSCGLRRAELCQLQLADLHAERRTLRVFGKGKKDRIVPVGGRALQWVERYLPEVRPRLCLDTRTQALFLTGYGGAVQSRRSQPHGVRLGAAGRACRRKGAATFSGTPAPPTCWKTGRTSGSSSSCLDTRSWTPPPFTPRSRSNSCRKSTPAAIHPPACPP